MNKLYTIIITIYNRQGHVQNVETYFDIDFTYANSVIERAFRNVREIEAPDVDDIKKGIFLIDIHDVNGDFYTTWSLIIP